jgi:phosphocarrier protein NPr/phosphocarrier protein
MTVERAVRVVNDLGLHLRAAGVLVQHASRFSAQVSLRRGKQSVDAKSIMSVLSLAATCGTELTLVCSGADAEQAADALVALFARGFDG